MTRTRSPLLVCVVVLLAGCLGGLGGSQTASPSASMPSATTTPSPTPTAAPPSTSTIAGSAAERMAVDAEKSRVERRVEGDEAVFSLGFGILRPAEAEVARRNGTGAFVSVSVGYSLELDCDGDGEPEEAIDGASTETTYFVSEEGDGERVRLTNVSRDVLSSERYC